MHPPLNAEHRSGCAEVMRALKDCHEDHPLAKYMGTCNDLKHALNMCYRAERVDKANQNHEKAKQRRKEVEEKWKAIEVEQ